MESSINWRTLMQENVYGFLVKQHKLNYLLAKIFKLHLILMDKNKFLFISLRVWVSKEF